MYSFLFGLLFACHKVINALHPPFSGKMSQQLSPCCIRLSCCLFAVLMTLDTFFTISDLSTGYFDEERTRQWRRVVCPLTVSRY